MRGSLVRSLRKTIPKYSERSQGDYKGTQPLKKGIIKALTTPGPSQAFRELLSRVQVLGFGVSGFGV